MRKLRPSLIFAIVMSLLVGVLLLVAQGRGYFQLRELSVTLTDEAPVSYQVYAEATRVELQKLLGKDIWSLDLKELEKDLRQREWIEDIVLLRQFPDRLSVRVKGQQPIALILDRKGQVRPMAVTAQILPSIRADQVPDLPVIQDRRIEGSLEIRTRIAKLLLELPKEGRLTLRTVDSISMGRSGQILIHHRSNKSSIHLGESEILLRSARVARVLDYLDHNQIGWKEINADFQKKVVVKKNTAQSPDLYIAQ